VADPGIPKRGCGERVWVTEVPSGVRGGGLRAKPPEATDITLTTSENFNTKTYTTRQKQDKLSARN